MSSVQDTSAESRRKILRPEDMRRRIEELGETPTQCLLCGTPDPERVFRRSGKWFWRCHGCDLVFVHDIFPEFVEDVGHLDGTYELRGKTPAPRRVERLAQGLLGELSPYQQKNRFLEVGCGQGQFLELVARGGWNVTGVDILPELAAIASEERGLDVRVGELFDANFEDESFDVVFMSEVIEHIVEPIELLREVHRILRPGGVALLRTGNARSWSARLRRGKWWYYMFGGHMHIRFYSPRAAQALGRAAGFERTECRTRGFAFLESEEVRGRWYRPFLQLSQGVISPLAGPMQAGHRLRMYFHRGA